MSGKRKLLAVDDDRLLRLSLGLLFEQQGYEVDTASTVVEALDALDRGTYELVLTDYRLPDGNGLEVARHARRIDPGANVLLMTGSDDGLDEDEVLRAGVIEILLKPCGMSQLVSKARGILDGRRPPSGLPAES